MAKLRHIALSVADLDQARKFFEDAFDMEMVGKAGAGVYMSDGTINIALLARHGRPLGYEGEEPFYGIDHFGIWVDDIDAACAKVEAAADASGERVWRLPHHAEYQEMMRSPVADIVNSAPVREAHPIQGAAFLSYFVDEKIPWAHLDIAGVSAVDSERDLYVSGPTGFGVRLLAEVAEGFARE